MAYAGTALKVLDLGFITATPSSAGAAGATRIVPSAVFLDNSSDAAQSITGTGYYAGIGATPYGVTNAAQWSRSSANIGARVGDLLCKVESSAGATPGRVTWHTFIGSTLAATTGSTGWGAAAYNMTVSVHAST